MSYCVVTFVNSEVIRIDGPFDTEKAANAFVDAEIKRNASSRVMKFAKYEVHRLYRP